MNGSKYLVTGQSVKVTLWLSKRWRIRTIHTGTSCPAAVIWMNLRKLMVPGNSPTAYTSTIGKYVTHAPTNPIRESMKHFQPEVTSFQMIPCIGTGNRSRRLRIADDPPVKRRFPDISVPSFPRIIDVWDLSPLTDPRCLGADYLTFLSGLFSMPQRKNLIKMRHGQSKKLAFYSMCAMITFDW